MIEQGGGKQSVSNPFSAELMTLQQIEGADDRALVEAEALDVRPIEIAASYGEGVRQNISS
ncbi:MAG: hypothetical protein ABIS20_15075 [Thermoanaerobaculia bacterium]